MQGFKCKVIIVPNLAISLYTFVGVQDLHLVTNDPKYLNKSMTKVRVSIKKAFTMVQS